MKKMCSVSMLAAITLCANTSPSEEGLLFNVGGIPSNIYIHTVAPNHYYPAAGIKLNTPGFNITSGCASIANEYCLFGVSDTQMATITTSGTGQSLNIILCLDGKAPASCQHYTQHAPIFTYLYVTNVGTSGNAAVLVCPILSNGTLGPCQDTGGGPSQFSLPGGIALTNEGSFAYAPNKGTGTGTITACPIESDGLFGTCFPDVPFNYSYGGVILNNTEDTLFVANYDSDYVGACPINPNGSLGTCIDSGVGAIFSNPTGLALNPNVNIAYVTNYNNDTVSLCHVSGGSFTSCSDSGFSFSGPEGITLNQAGTYAYIPEYDDGTVTLCSVNQSTGAFTGCAPTGGLFSNPWSIVLNEVPGNAYIADFGNNTVNVCAIATNGTLNNCLPLIDPAFNGPAGTALLNNFLD